MQIAVKTMIYLGIDLAKEIYWKYYKNLLRNIKQYVNKWKDMSYYSLRKLSVIKINSVHKRYKFPVMPIRTTLSLLRKPAVERFAWATITKDGNRASEGFVQFHHVTIACWDYLLGSLSLKKLILSGFVVFITKS